MKMGTLTEYSNRREEDMLRKFLRESVVLQMSPAAIVAVLICVRSMRGQPISTALWVIWVLLFGFSCGATIQFSKRQQLGI